MFCKCCRGRFPTLNNSSEAVILHGGRWLFKWTNKIRRSYLTMLLPRLCWVVKDCQCVRVSFDFICTVLLIHESKMIFKKIIPAINLTIINVLFYLTKILRKLFKIGKHWNKCKLSKELFFSKLLIFQMKGEKWEGLIELCNYTMLDDRVRIATLSARVDLDHDEVDVVLIMWTISISIVFD